MRPFVVMAVSLLFVAGCHSTPAVVEPQNYYAEISFQIDGGPQINSDFHEQLFNDLNGRQIRNGPVGLDAGEFLSPDYKLQIIGNCEDAIRDVAPTIYRAAKHTHDPSLIMKSFKQSAECVFVKREQSSPSPNLPNDLPYAVPVTSGQQVSQ